MKYCECGNKLGDPRSKMCKACMKGEKHPNWTGNNIKYVSLHNWVKYHLGKAITCEFCGTDKNVDWASKSHKAKRNLNDYIQLCRKCHHLFDRSSHINLLYKNNSSGFPGVGFHKKTGKWRVREFLFGKQIQIGMFVNIEEAIKVRKEMVSK